jgi:hypothetical protein
VLDSTAVLNILIFFRFVNINAQTQFWWVSGLCIELICISAIFSLVFVNSITKNKKLVR